MTVKLIYGDGAREVCEALKLETNDYLAPFVVEYEGTERGYVVCAQNSRETNSIKMNCCGDIELEHIDRKKNTRWSFQVKPEGTFMAFVQRSVDGELVGSPQPHFLEYPDVMRRTICNIAYAAIKRAAFHSGAKL